jgi:hypothetical protein
MREQGMKYQFAIGIETKCWTEGYNQDIQWLGIALSVTLIGA